MLQNKNYLHFVLNGHVSDNVIMTNSFFQNRKIKSHIRKIDKTAFHKICIKINYYEK